MVGSRRWVGAALTGLSLITGTGVVGGTVATLSPDPIAGSATVQDKPSGAQEPTVKAVPGTPQPAEDPGRKPDVASVFSQPGDDPPRPFVPLHPSTVDDRQQTEAMRLYAAARGLEDRGSFNEAVALLQQAQKLDPDSVAIARRLSRIYLGALSKPELAVEFGKKVLAIEPGDTDTLSRLVEFYSRKNDTAGCQSVLKEVLANPKLDARSPGRLLAQYELGKLYAEKLNQV